MDHFYYTLASLPTLLFERKAPFPSLEKFWDYVSHTDPSIRAEFERSESTTSFLSEYREFDRSLRTVLARIRLDSLKWKEQIDLLEERGSEYAQIALEALSQSNPLEAELALDRIRWKFIEDRSSDRQFDRTAFFAYVLKLELLIRLSNLEERRGQKVFDDLHAAVLARTDLSIQTGEQPK